VILLAQNTGKTKGSPGCGTGRKVSANGNYTKRESVTGKFSDSKNAGTAFKGAAKEDERAAKRRAAALALFEAAYDNHNKIR